MALNKVVLFVEVVNNVVSKPQPPPPAATKFSLNAESFKIILPISGRNKPYEPELFEWPFVGVSPAAAVPADPLIIW